MPRLADHRAKIELLRAAEAEFAEHGLAAAKVEAITARAGVSKGAVSFALNGRPGVSAETRQRILDIAAQLNWRPNSAALATALVLGGNIRTGLEDHLYLPNGQAAPSNGAMVEVAARMTRDVGREPATVDEARKILSLDAFAAGRDAAKDVAQIFGANA